MTDPGARGVPKSYLLATDTKVDNEGVEMLYLRTHRVVNILTKKKKQLETHKYIEKHEVLFLRKECVRCLPPINCI